MKPRSFESCARTSAASGFSRFPSHARGKLVRCRSCATNIRIPVMRDPALPRNLGPRTSQPPTRPEPAAEPEASRRAQSPARGIQSPGVTPSIELPQYDDGPSLAAAGPDRPRIESGRLYAHVPFCRHKCHYCDFYSLVDHRDRTSRFADRFELEAEAVRAAIDPVADSNRLRRGRDADASGPPMLCSGARRDRVDPQRQLRRVHGRGESGDGDRGDRRDAGRRGRRSREPGVPEFPAGAPEDARAMARSQLRPGRVDRLRRPGSAGSASI